MNTTQKFVQSFIEKTLGTKKQFTVLHDPSYSNSGIYRVLNKSAAQHSSIAYNFQGGYFTLDIKIKNEEHHKYYQADKLDIAFREISDLIAKIK